MFGTIHKLIRTYDSFLITSHVNPDGDAIGSEMALKLFLEDLDKEVFVVNASPTPSTLTFLDPNGDILHFGSDVDRSVFEKIDAIFILDLNNWEQLGVMAGPVQHSPLPKICIDHHEGIADDFVSTIASDRSASATGLLIYELIVSMKGKLRREIAEALYAAIVTDTGTFRFSNTDARTLRTAAALVEAGVSPFDMHQRVFASKSWGTARLLGPVLSTIESAADGRLVWIHATRKMIDDAESTYDDMDGFVDLVRAVGGVELVLFFKETLDGTIKVSLRSNGRVDAFSVAKSFGGGGHTMAAGMRLDGPLDEAIEKAVAVCLRVDGVRE